MKIVIRNAVAEDYSSLIKLFEEIDAIHRDNLPRLFRKPKGPIREFDYFAGLISDESAAVFVAEWKENLIGFVHAIVRDAPDIPVLVPRRYTVVDSIVVNSEYRKSGVGRMLLEVVEEWSKKYGATAIELNVYEFNEEAKTFYENLGFETFSLKLTKEFR